MTFALGKYNYGSGAGWKSVKERKKARGNQTTGKTKGLACHASTMDRHMAKSSRAYKHRDYGVWMTKTRGGK